MSSFYGCCNIGGGGGTPGMPGPPGKDGRGIKNTSMDVNGNLVITYTDSETPQIIGKVVGPEGTVFVPVITGTILSWTNDGGLPNPEPTDLAKTLSESDYWQDITGIVKSKSGIQPAESTWGNI